MDADIKAASARTSLLGKPSNRITNPLRVACVVFPAALFLGLAWVDYREELARTRNDVATATNALAEHARTVVESINLVLARVLDHIDNQDWTTLTGSLDTHEFLDQLRHDLPQVEAVFLTDPTGTIAASTRAYPMPRHDVHNAEYFAAVKAQNSDAVVISAPSRHNLRHHRLHDKPPTGAGWKIRRCGGGNRLAAIFREHLSCGAGCPRRLGRRACSHGWRNPGAVPRSNRPSRSRSQHPTR